MEKHHSVDSLHDGTRSRDDSKGNGMLKPQNAPPKASAGDRSRFACPCFKREPQLYRPESDCAKSSWKIPRLKEHLRRQHLPQFECGRCFGGFLSERKLSVHQGNCAGHATGDEGRPAQVAQQKYERITDQRLFRGKSDHDKWSIIFGILYPEVPVEEYPSPYHEYGSVYDFVELILQQQPRHFAAGLDQLPLQDSSEDLRERLLGALRTSLLRVYQDFQASRGLSLVPPDSQNNREPEHASFEPQPPQEANIRSASQNAQAHVDEVQQALSYLNEDAFNILANATFPADLDFNDESWLFPHEEITNGSELGYDLPNVDAQFGS